MLYSGILCFFYNDKCFLWHGFTWHYTYIYLAWCCCLQTLHLQSRYIPVCRTQGVVYRFSAHRRQRSFLRIQRVLVEDAIRNSIWSFYDRGNVTIVVSLRMNNLCLLLDDKSDGNTGYSYCHSCSDFQALMPRSGTETGYDSMHVCGFCIEFLTSLSSTTYIGGLK